MEGGADGYQTSYGQSCTTGSVFEMLLNAFNCKYRVSSGKVKMN